MSIYGLLNWNCSQDNPYSLSSTQAKQNTLQQTTVQTEGKEQRKQRRTGYTTKQPTLSNGHTLNC